MSTTTRRLPSRRLFHACLAPLIFFLAACGEPTLDLSSEAAFSDSMERVQNALSDGKREEFRDAMRIILLSQIDPMEFLSGSLQQSPNPTPKADARLKALLHGKTAEEVIALAEDLLRQ